MKRFIIFLITTCCIATSCQNKVAKLPVYDSGKLISVIDQDITLINSNNDTLIYRITNTFIPTINENVYIYQNKGTFEASHVNNDDILKLRKWADNVIQREFISFKGIGIICIILLIAHMAVIFFRDSRTFGWVQWCIVISVELVASIFYVWICLFEFPNSVENEGVIATRILNGKNDTMVLKCDNNLVSYPLFYGEDEAPDNNIYIYNLYTKERDHFFASSIKYDEATIKALKPTMPKWFIIPALCFILIIIVAIFTAKKELS